MNRLRPLRILSGLFAALLLLTVPTGLVAEEFSRRIIPLDGVWQIAEGKMEQAPLDFTRTVPVPGLVSLATPAFEPLPGPPVPDRWKPAPVKDPAREAFWYRRTFRLDQSVPAVARLKVSKAMFGTRVVLNGQVIGDHQPNVIPGYFDVRMALRPGENELLVRVGADRTAGPKNVPSLHDFEKERYIPGIFDSVELILSGTPHFLHVQTAPDITAKTVRVQAVLRNDGAATESAVAFVVREAKSGRVVGRISQPAVAFPAAAETTVDVRIQLEDCRLWSPEDPFLYRIEADSGADRFSARFGMREFKFDPLTQSAMLNGQPYFMRGSNITLYRFFEDAECRDLPWRADWVRLLHQRIKDMNWNCLRYSIGLPPEAWYDIADELGILIQDEFPVWGKEGLDREELTREYAGWMRERWNHPSVVIWDAQNETQTDETGAALSVVRSLDLSNRPWDNGWGPAMAATDSYEAHPYNFASGGASLADMVRLKPTPRGGGPSAPYDGTHPVIINEYGYLWLNRAGDPTTLTSDFYRNLLGEKSTAAQRFHVYATYLAADTEYWRTTRQAAAVMHFTALGYSRKDGQTGDHWTDLTKLAWEPEFHRYLRDAFAPVGLMVDFWTGTGITGRPARIPIRLINDLGQPWSGPVTFRVRPASGSALSVSQQQVCRMGPYGDATLSFDFAWPEQAGDYVVEAELARAGGETVRSMREVSVVDVRSLGLAHGRRAFASSSRSAVDGPGNAVDGDPSSTWTTGSTEPSWLVVDLGAVHRISRVRIAWGREFSRKFSLQVSTDGQSWKEVHEADNDRAGATGINLAPTDARFVRFTSPASRPDKPGERRGSSSYAIREFQVFE